MRDRIVAVTREVVALLVDRDYVALERLTQGRLLSAKDIAFAVMRYGRVLAYPPDEAYSRLRRR